MLAVQERFTECDDASVPVPLSASLIVDGTALLVKFSVAVALPATWGLKVTVKERSDLRQ